jgi:hypothetical protein
MLGTKIGSKKDSSDNLHTNSMLCKTTSLPKGEGAVQDSEGHQGNVVIDDEDAEDEAMEMFMVEMMMVKMVVMLVIMVILVIV